MNQYFQKWVAGGLLFCNSLLWGTISMSTPVVAQERTSQEICMEAIGAAKTRILDGRTINLQARLLNLPDSSGYPGDRSQALSFTMARSSGVGATRDGLTVLASPVFMKSIATNVIEQCRSFSYVEFGGANSAWYIPFGLINGNVEEFQCIEEELLFREGGTLRSMPWGFYDCSI